MEVIININELKFTFNKDEKDNWKVSCSIDNQYYESDIINFDRMENVTAETIVSLLSKNTYVSVNSHEINITKITLEPYRNISITLNRRSVTNKKAFSRIIRLEDAVNNNTKDNTLLVEDIKELRRDLDNIVKDLKTFQLSIQYETIIFLDGEFICSNAEHEKQIIQYIKTFRIIPNDELHSKFVAISNSESLTEIVKLTAFSIKNIIHGLHHLGFILVDNVSEKFSDYEIKYRVNQSMQVIDIFTQKDNYSKNRIGYIRRVIFNEYECARFFYAKQ